MAIAVFSERLRRLAFITVLSLCSLHLASCKDDNDAPDVSDIKVQLNTRRFDRDLAAIDTTRIAASLPSLKQKYPDFLDFWLDNLMQFGVNGDYSENSVGVREQLRTFLTYKDFRGLFDTVAKHYPDTRKIDEPLNKGFQYYKHYYPQKGIPKVVYFISGLNNWSAVTVDTEIVAIGLDMFLGEAYPYYKSVGVPEYMSMQLRPEAAPVFAFRALYQDQYPFKAEGKTLLDLMIQRGKEQYFLSKVLPFLEEETRLGFTKAQLEWCRENEALVYNFFIKSNMLYETNWGKILRYVNDGPSAAGMPAESPGNIGTWTGLQIVKAYLARHPKMSLEQLHQQQDAQVMLQESGYKPR